MQHTHKADLNLDVRRNIYDEKGKDVTPAKAEGGDATANGESNRSLEESLKHEGLQYFCYSCGKDCTRLRYHNSKNPPHGAAQKPSKDQRYDLCSLCYQEGRFPASTTAADYTKLENEQYRSISDKESPWSESEILYLLEGLEMFDDNWESVADHVGSRTREECVLKFLQLDIEDKYVDDAPSANGHPSTAGVASQDLAFLSGGRVPFSQSDNPVMSVMSFLAGLADPATTAKAAGKSVDEIRRTLKARIERDTTPGADSKNNKQPAPESTSADTDAPHSDTENMDIDDRTTALAAPAPPPTGPHDFATTALGLTAARAAVLASHTERQLTAQVSLAVNLQLQKLELKLAQFSEMEALQQAERRELERMTQRLFLDRLAFRRKVRAAEEGLQGLRLAVPPEERLGLASEGNGTPATHVEPFSDAVQGFIRHEI